MIDVGGPAMPRGGEELRPRRAGLPPAIYDAAGRAARARRALARDAARARRHASPPRPATRRRSPPGSRGGRRFRRSSCRRSRSSFGLAYGENPHQRAAYYAERGARTHLLARVEQLHGSELSYNNLNDLDAARLLVREFTCRPARSSSTPTPAASPSARRSRGRTKLALAADPLSAYGGVVALNRPVSAALGERLAEQFVEVLSRRATTRPRSRRWAQAGDSGSSTTGAARPEASTRLPARARRPARAGARLGRGRPRADAVVAGRASEAAWGDLLFA